MNIKFVHSFILLGLLLSIFTFWPAHHVAFEVPKVAVFEWFVRVLTLFFMYVFLTKKRVEKIDKKITILILVFVLYSTFISLFGMDVGKSLVGNYYRSDGLLTLYTLVVFSFLISCFWKPELKIKFASVYFYSSLLLSIITIFEILSHKFDVGNAVTFGNPIYLTGFLSIVIPFGYYLFKITNKKIYIYGSIVIALAILVVGVIGPILTVFLFSVLILLTEFKSKLRFVLIMIPVTFASFLFINWVSEYNYKNNISLIYEGRARIFRNLFVAFTNRPLKGYGWSNVDYAFESVEWPVKVDNDVYLDKAHSEILELLVTTGIFGTVFYLVLLFFLLKKSYRMYLKTKDVWHLTTFMILILFIFHSQTNIISFSEQVVLWLVVGLDLLNLQEV